MPIINIFTFCIYFLAIREDFYLDSSESDIEEITLASPVRSNSPIVCISNTHTHSH